MKQEFDSIAEFYPYYLKQHAKPSTRILHAAGITLAMMCLGAFLATGRIGLIPIAISLGYGLAWCGHFFIEKNHPASFEHPLMSLICDFKMFNDMLSGGLNFDAPK